MEENNAAKTTGREPSAIERDIAETRESIDSTVEELGQRLAPSQLVDDAKSFVKEKAMQRATTIWARMSENAVPLGLIGGGVIWMLRSGRAGNGQFSRESYAWNDHSRGVRPRPFSEQGDGGVGARAVEQVREAADHVRERATEIGSQAKHTTNHLMGGAREQLETLRTQQPLLLGVAALALGALVGGLLPTTRREDELLGEARDQVLGAAAEAGREKAEQAREAIETAKPGSAQGAEQEGAWAAPSPR